MKEDTGIPNIKINYATSIIKAIQLVSNITVKVYIIQSAIYIESHYKILTFKFVSKHKILANIFLDGKNFYADNMLKILIDLI